MNRITSAITLIFLATVFQGNSQEVIYDFSRGVDTNAVFHNGADISSTGNALRINTFHSKDWPGITLKAPNGSWDFSGKTELAADMKNTGTNNVAVCWRVDNQGADGTRKCITEHIELEPEQTGTLRVTLPARQKGPDAPKLFGMRGYPAGMGTNETINPAEITQFLFFVSKPAVNHSFEITKITAGGTPPSLPQGRAFFPFIDTFGQYIHKDWPGKIHSMAELTGRRETEAAELIKITGPPDWDKFGGWNKGPSLKATGFFRTEKVNGIWWLVDPDGKLFFSHGIDCVRMLDYTPVDERADWFGDFPGAQPEFTEFSSKHHALHGHYAGNSPLCFSFAGANLRRKYGTEWRTVSAGVVHQRLRSWGMNTIANWSDTAVSQLKKTPYVATVNIRSRQLEGSKGYWGKFCDVFDVQFKEQAQKSLAREKGKSAGDPWCLGFFVDNELSWGDDTSLAIGALCSPPDQTAKKVFIGDLKEKYKTIETLNSAWATKHSSWDDLLQSRECPDKIRARDDLVAFYSKTAELYFKTIRDAVRETAPNQLYLGCRFAWANNEAVAAAVKCCDVVSYNFYRKSVADFKLPGGADRPVIIGEFHFGALDRGMFHTGLVKVKNQAERAATYSDFVTGVLRNPAFVGCHWFQYRDEPTTGRALDEENYQIGFVDVTDTPYPETVEAARTIGQRMYQERSGSRK